MQDLYNGENSRRWLLYDLVSKGGGGGLIAGGGEYFDRRTWFAPKPSSSLWKTEIPALRHLYCTACSNICIKCYIYWIIYFWLNISAYVKNENSALRHLYSTARSSVCLRHSLSFSVQVHARWKTTADSFLLQHSVRVHRWSERECIVSGPPTSGGQSTAQAIAAVLKFNLSGGGVQ